MKIDTAVFPADINEETIQFGFYTIHFPSHETWTDNEVNPFDQRACENRCDYLAMEDKGVLVELIEQPCTVTLFHIKWGDLRAEDERWTGDYPEDGYYNGYFDNGIFNGDFIGEKMNEEELCKLFDEDVDICDFYDGEDKVVYQTYKPKKKTWAFEVFELEGFFFDTEEEAQVWAERHGYDPEDVARQWLDVKVPYVDAGEDLCEIDGKLVEADPYGLATYADCGTQYAEYREKLWELAEEQGYYREIVK